jgi:hypothetical protein
MPSNNLWLKRFRQAGAIWTYKPGGLHASYEMARRHAGFYFNSDVVVSYPNLVVDCVTALADICAENLIKPIWVASYTATVCSSLVLASHLSEKLGARFGYIDLHLEICRFVPSAGEPVLIVTDDIHSGGSIEKCISLIEKAGGKVIGPLLTLANLSGRASINGIEISALFTQPIENWPADRTCSLCAAGSMPVPARQEWRQLTEGKE